ncbi:MAG TPA: ferredoxin [Kiritimatiellia bacterium]|nr:ferredoxin [Kiritimatiellia bacterium]HRU69738.1 ferredoxin [Kiritimatiellia bacterium]
MKANVDKETCIGCGLCTTICPAVFAMQGAVAEVIATPVPSSDESACREAAESCPVAAITITEQ